MKTPLPIIKAYYRRIKRGDITIDDIRNKQTREDVYEYIINNPFK